MANRRFEMHEYRQVIHRMRMGQSDRAISESKLMGRLKCAQVRAVARQQGWLDSNVPIPDNLELAKLLETEKDSNPTRESLSLSHEERIRLWIEQGIWGTTIYRALVDQFGFEGSYSSVRRLMQKLRSQTPKATCILDFAPGEAAQVDFGKGPVITDVFTGEAIPTWIFVMTLCFSRHMYAEIVRNQKVETWLSLHRRAFEFFAGVPSRLIVDNAKCAIVRACFHDPEVQRSYGELAEGYGFDFAVPARRPEEEGESRIGREVCKKRVYPSAHLPDSFCVVPVFLGRTKTTIRDVGIISLKGLIFWA